MSASEEDAVLVYMLRKKLQKRYKKRQFSVHSYNIIHARQSQYIAVQNLRNYPDKFFNYHRMSISSYDYLLSHLFEKIKNETTNWREPISAGERLTITLRFLAEGCSYHRLAYDFFRGVSTVAQIIPETCEAIWTVLQPQFMPFLNSSQWESIATRYERLWNLPNCVGSIDGKYIRIRSFDNSGSTNYNYKNFFSVVLLACADADGLFISIEVGAPGRNSDGGVFRTSKLEHFLNNNTFNLPPPRSLPNNENVGPIPFYFCADEAFPLMKNLMRPYPKRGLNNMRRIFNFRLFRGRKSIECAFGMLTAKFQIFAKPIQCSQKILNTIVKSACVLHNFIKSRDGWTTEPDSLECIETERLLCIHDYHTSRKQSYIIRDNLARHFITVAPIHNQLDYIM